MKKHNFTNISQQRPPTTVVAVLIIVILMSVMPSFWTNSCFLYAQKAKQPPPAQESVAYKIQIGAYRNISMSKAETLQDLGNLYIEDAGNGIHRLVMGYYASSAQADSLVLKIQERGFAGAFTAVQKGNTPPDGVIAYKDLPSTASNAAPTTPSNTTPPVEHTDKNDDAATAAPIPPTATTTTTPAADPAEEGLYAIEIGGYDQLANKKVEELLEYGNLFVPRNDAEGRLMLGPFATKADADQAMSKVHLAGFWNATFRRVSADNTILREAQETPPDTQNKNPNPSATTATAKEEAAGKSPLTAPPATIYKPNADSGNNSNNETTPAAAPSPAAGGSNADITQKTTLPENSPIALPEAELQKSLLLAPETKSYQDFKAYFTLTTPDSLHNIEPYDPTLEESADEALLIDDIIVQKNAKLKGQLLPDYLAFMLDSIPRDPEWQYYGIYRFAIDNAHDGYLLRAGKGQYHNDNLIYLQVYDRKVGDFTQAIKICSVWGGSGLFGFMQSWLLDLNADGIEDLLTYSILENTSPNSDKIVVSDSFKASVWVNSQYIGAQIVDEAALRQKLGIGK